MIPEGVTTHKRGNHLDQIFTNLAVLSVAYAEPVITDHVAVMCKLIFKRGDSDIDIHKMPVKITAAEIRRHACSSETIMKMMDPEYSIMTRAK